MAKPSSLTAQDRDNLVAYLDGELDERTARALEAKLSRDPQARSEAEALKRTFNLLDYLPRGEASSQFASRTLDRLATVQPATVAASDSDQSADRVRPAQGPRHWPQIAGWSCALLAAAMMGYFGTHCWVQTTCTPEDVDALHSVAGAGKQKLYARSVT